MKASHAFVTTFFKLFFFFPVLCFYEYTHKELIFFVTASLTHSLNFSKKKYFSLTPEGSETTPAGTHFSLGGEKGLRRSENCSCVLKKNQQKMPILFSPKEAGYVVRYSFP